MYFNAPQRENMQVAAHDTYIVASRGLGKSEGFDAFFMLRNMLAMPRSCGGFVSPTYSKALTNTLPAIITAFERWGYVRNRHFFAGVYPPKTAGFREPHVKPLSYDNVFSLYNGSIMHILSLDRNMSANSMNLDWLLISEARYVDYDKLKNEVLPANRGNRQYFQKCPWHHSLQATTDMPTGRSGTWILDKRNECDHALIEQIKSAQREVTLLKKIQPQNPHIQRRIKEFEKDLAWMRTEALFYAEYSIIDHFEIVGERWIEQMKRDLPPLIFRASILNERIGKIENGFYSALSEKLHFYMPPRDNGRLSLAEIDKYRGINCLGDSDLAIDEPLWIAFDANAAICTAVTGQIRNGQLLTLKDFFVKTPLKLTELVQKLCDYYQPKVRLECIICYDSSFTNKSANASESFIDTICRVFESRRWSVRLIYTGRIAGYEWRHKEIDRALKGDPDLLFPRFNLPNCEYLRLAMEQAGVKTGARGFSKDKDAEKYPDSPQRPDELKTHITDAWDTLFIGANFHRDKTDRELIEFINH